MTDSASSPPPVDPIPEPASGPPQDACAMAHPTLAPARADRALPGGSEWTFDLIGRYDREIARIARGYGLDTYANQIEVISAEQMMDAYASHGMPVGYTRTSWRRTRCRCRRW